MWFPARLTSVLQVELISMALQKMFIKMVLAESLLVVSLLLLTLSLKGAKRMSHPGT